MQVCLIVLSMIRGHRIHSDAVAKGCLPLMHTGCISIENAIPVTMNVPLTLNSEVVSCVPISKWLVANTPRRVSERDEISVYSGGVLGSGPNLHCNNAIEQAREKVNIATPSFHVNRYFSTTPVPAQRATQDFDLRGHANRMVSPGNCKPRQEQTCRMLFVPRRLPEYRVRVGQNLPLVFDRRRQTLQIENFAGSATKFPSDFEVGYRQT